MYKHSRQALPNSISTLFQRNTEIHNHNTRNSNDYFMHEARTNTRKFTIKYSGPLFWNSIPEHLQNSTSENQFKNKLKQSCSQHIATCPNFPLRLDSDLTCANDVFYILMNHHYIVQLSFCLTLLYCARMLDYNHL